MFLVNFEVALTLTGLSPPMPLTSGTIINSYDHKNHKIVELANIPYLFDPGVGVKSYDGFLLKYTGAFCRAIAFDLLPYITMDAITATPII